MSSVSMIRTAVSEFIVNSCIVHPNSNRNRIFGLLRLLGPAERNCIDVSPTLISALTGSALEFFKKPMLPCVNDFDVCSHLATLVVPTRYHVPFYVQLPVEFHNSEEIELYEFVDIQIPCHVFKRLIGELRKCEGDDSYTFVPETGEYYLNIDQSTDGTTHGPARRVPNLSTITQYRAGPRVEFVYSQDDVQCYRCLEWPPQAADWTTRVRRHTIVPIQQLFNVLLTVDAT